MIFSRPLTNSIRFIKQLPAVAAKNHQGKWNGVNLVNLYAPASKNLEAIVHTFLSVLKARQCNADILHIHAIGPGLMVP